MATCNIDELLADACTNKFSCLSEAQQRAVMLELLCDLAAGGGGGGGGVWGSIIGTLSDQTDLQAALDTKVDVAGDTMTGDLLFSPDNTHDIGASGATRPATGYFGTELLSPLVSIAAASASVRFGATFGTYDAFIVREAANILALRNGANAQTLHWYNTFTDASNYERGAIRFAANVMEIAMENAGTGTTRGFQINILGSARFGVNTGGQTWITSGRRFFLEGTATSQAGGYFTAASSGIGFGVNGNLLAWTMPSTGHLLANADNTYDIGASGATRPRALYLAGGITHGSATLLTTTTALTDGAAAAGGTLLNAPAAGNPTKWVPINDNGTTRYIPAW